MARTPEWFTRLDKIVSLLESSEVEWFGRQEMQALFGVSERDSIRLLHKFGAQEQHNALTLSRTALLPQLEAIRSGALYSAFLRRRQDVALQLQVAQAESVARQRRISGSPAFAKAPSFQHLPVGVTLQPGRVVFEFTTPAELWTQIDRLADMAAQDPEEFEARTAQTVSK